MGSSSQTSTTARESFSNESVEYILLNENNSPLVGGGGNSSSYHDGLFHSPRSTSSSINRVIYVPQRDNNIQRMSSTGSNSHNSIPTMARDTNSSNSNRNDRNRNDDQNHNISTMTSETRTATTPQQPPPRRQETKSCEKKGKKRSYYSSLQHLMAPLLPIKHSPTRRRRSSSSDDDNDHDTYRSNDVDEEEEEEEQDVIITTNNVVVGTTSSTSRRGTLYFDTSPITRNENQNNHNDDADRRRNDANIPSTKVEFLPSTEFRSNSGHSMSDPTRPRAETELTNDDEEVAMLLHHHHDANRCHSERDSLGISATLSSSNRNFDSNHNIMSSRNDHDDPHYVVIRNRFHPNQPIELNGLNYLNAVTYGAHLFVSWGVGVWGLDHIVDTRWEITTTYETLITPSEWSSFYVLAIIMITESIFTIAQLVRYYRARSIIQAGTKFYFFYTFLWQTAFTLFYCYKLFIVSFLSIIGTLLSLLLLIYSQEQHNSYSSYSSSSMNHGSGIGIRNMILSTTSPSHHQQRRSQHTHMTEYCLFRLPFYIHTGYTFCLTVNHLSLLVRYYTGNHHMSFQLCIDMIALALLLPVATYSLTRYEPDFVIPIVIMLNYLGIGCRLGHPSVMLVELYGPVIIYAVRYASFSLAGIVLCCLIPNAIIWFARTFCTINVIELDD